MKNKILFTCFIFLCLHQVAFGQFVNIPQPTRYYPLDNKSAGDVINSRNNGSIYGTVQSVSDRFSNTTGAMFLNPKAGITIPPLDELYRNISNGFTLSFWTRITNPITKNSGIKPWADTDNIYRYFSVNKNTVPLFGFERIRDRAVINRHAFPSRYANPVNWKLWFWDPTDFTLQTGWYHIVIVCESSRTRLFVFKPNGEIADNMHYFRFQDLTAGDLLTEFGSLQNEKELYLDDFKFFNKAFSRDEIMQLHGQDAAPQGMYYINTALSGNRLIHSSGNSYNADNNVELYDFSEERQSLYKWVIEPVANKTNTYYIRLAYVNRYLGPANNSTSASTTVQIRNAANSNDLLYREWIIEPVPGGIGYYYIKFARNTSMYLHTWNNSGNNSTALEIFTFVQANAQSYKWKLNLINTNYELQNTSFTDNSTTPKVIVSDINPFLQIIPDDPNATTPRYGIVNNRWATPINNRMLWYLTPSLDGSFLLGSQNTTNRLYPENNNVQAMNVNTWVVNFDSNNSHAFRWVLDRSDNIFGSRYRIRLATNPLVQLTTHNFSSRINLPVGGVREVRGVDSLSNVPAQRWMFFNTSQNASRPPNEQIYNINPGVYRIQLIADTARSIVTEGNRFTPSTRLVIGNKEAEQELSHYWYIDYERTASGEPVKDGSYLIKLIGTDQYMHTVGHSLNSGTRLEIFTLEKDNISTYKFFIRPEGGGQYSMSIAGDRSQLVHTAWNDTATGTVLELYTFEPTNVSSFRWRFQKVNFNNDIQDGVYVMQSNANSIYSVTTNSEIANIRPSDRVILKQSDVNRVIWNIEKDKDGTYMIYYNANPKLYMHTYNNDTGSNTPLEVFPQENTDVRYPFTYRWIAESTGTPDVFRFRFVSPGAQYLYIRDTAPATNAPLVIYTLWNSKSFEWKLTR